ncbi:MAG: phosphate/phosphite/phosphonate ABC transporter substrate-binding protein [Nitrospirota bacterium]|jgi:phosphonate transport system substrate-binding protein
MVLALLTALLLLPVGGGADDEFLIGLIPEQNIFKQVKQHRPLATYLSKKLDVPVRLTVLSRYHHIVDRFVSRGMDGAFFGILTAALAEEELGVVPIARPVNPDGKSTAQSYIFVRADSGISTVEDMAGKRAAFVDKVTATGYLFAVAYLKSRGAPDIDTFFSEHYFTGSHDTVVYSVLAGRADVGAVKGRILEKIMKDDPVVKSQIRVLARSGELPDNTLCVRADLPEEFILRLTEVLLSMHEDEEGRKVLKQMGAVKFVPAREEDFQPVRRLAEKAGIDIKHFTYE